MVYFCDLAEHARKVAAEYHDYFKEEGSRSWLMGVFGGWGTWILHILIVGLMIFSVIVIMACIKVMIGVCVCVRKFTTVTTMVVHEVSLDQPSLKTQKTQKMKNLV